MEANFLTTTDLDAASSSITMLRELLNSGELALLNEKPSTKAQQLTRLAHLVGSLESVMLRTQLEKEILAKNIEFFSTHRMRGWIEGQQKMIDRVGVVHLEVAVNFKLKDVEYFRELLSVKIGGPVVLEITVTKSLIGGAIVQHGTYRMDASVKSRLERFGKSWQQASK